MRIRTPYTTTLTDESLPGSILRAGLAHGTCDPRHKARLLDTHDLPPGNVRSSPTLSIYREGHTEVVRDCPAKYAFGFATEERLDLFLMGEVLMGYLYPLFGFQPKLSPRYLARAPDSNQATTGAGQCVPNVRHLPKTYPTLSRLRRRQAPIVNRL